MDEHVHVAEDDLYRMVHAANRQGASRALVGPVAMRLLRGAYAPYDGPPGPEVTETLLGLPIEEDAEIPDLGWQLHDQQNRVFNAGRFTVHDCGGQ